MGPAAAVWAILDKVVDDYAPVADGIDDDIEEVETDVFDDDIPAPTARIYHLKREVIEFHRAVYPLLGPLEALERGAYERDPRGAPPLLPRRPRPRPAGGRAGQLPARAADQRPRGEPGAGQRQPERGREEDLRLAPAIIAVPTFIASIYGMNFEHMPELDQSWGYPLALAVMALCVVVLISFFRRINWL